MTLLSTAVAKKLDEGSRPLVSSYDIFRIVWEIHRDRKVKYLRGDRPSKGVFRRTMRELREDGDIREDGDYWNMWRLMSKSLSAADEIVCLADHYCYISHLSAMQRYGLTVRRPEALHITHPAAALAKELRARRLQTDFGDVLEGDVYIERLPVTHHPPRVRDRRIIAFATKHPGEHRQIRGTFARVGTIGQTFLDMIEAPERCGGMMHVLDVWTEHAETYLEEIIVAVEGTTKKIDKVRAGYILAERIGISDQRVLAWRAFAQRGGSRVLDPSRPYIHQWSDDWMISINVM